MIRYFDAFAGIGGFRSAFERVGGFECVGYCEIDHHARKAYQTLYDTGGEVCYEDIRTVDTAAMPYFELLCGGFPCQPFSTAGKRKAFEDERGTLFFELARILEAKRPAYFLFENVPHLLGIEKGSAFRKILETLSELGYCVEWFVHNSTDFHTPQVRKRVYLAGCLGGDCSGEILAFRGGSKKNLHCMIQGSQGNRVYLPDGKAVTQCAGSGGRGGKTGLYWIDMNPPPTITDFARCLTARQNNGITRHKGEHSAVLVEDAPRAIINPHKEKVYQNGRRYKEPNEPMYTVTAADRHGVIHHGRIRRLMPIECWRLQGFTDEQFQKVQALGISDSQLYKMAGNAVTVSVVEEIARNLQRFHEKRTGGTA